VSAQQKKPTEKELTKLREADEGFTTARDNAVSYMQSRRQATYNIARKYRLDPEELFQESYEVLLTCLRDYTPVYEKEEGKFIEVQFNTFFGNRLESRAMEMRNRDPEYQARQAVTEGMSAEEKERFRADPPLLVQHLDHESPMQEHLSREVSLARASAREDIRFKIMRDSFFDRKLSELVAREKDEKKQAALLHVKVGGVYNFQEIAYHFGVTDSRASQVMNELMDAFYVQRLIDGDVEAVEYDFRKLKFNEKRVLRLLKEAVDNASDERREELGRIFAGLYPDIKKMVKEAAKRVEHDDDDTSGPEDDYLEDNAPPAYEEVFSEKENDKFPLIEVGLRPIASLKLLELEFRPPEDDDRFNAFVRVFDENSALYPIVVSEEGYVIDGERRLRAAQAKGKTEYLCLTRKFTQDFDRKLMRVVLNMRLHKSNKIEMYYAIRALSSLGLSQQKIADYLGTSRTNVLVYCKVRDKASPVLRALFEDGYVQITNASACVDLSEDIQAQIAAFIRRHGMAWSKGAKFNKLFAAAAEDRVAELEASLGGKSVKAPVVSAGAAADPHLARKLEALEKQLETYAKALKDAEVWAAQREAVINSQREQLNQTRSEADILKRELEASELIKFGNPKAIEDELKQVRQFYQISERMAGAQQGMEGAAQAVRRTELRRNQVVELVALMDELEKALNALRLEIHNRGAQLGVAKKVG
jgi:ParB-like chromosome segregation protein Spo0J